MSRTALLVTVIAVGLVLWWGRRIPLTGGRKWLTIGCRAFAVTALCAGFWGLSYQRTREAPRQVMYLVDESASIDDAQRAWIARRIVSLEALRPSVMERAVVAFGADARLAVPFSREPLADPAALTRLLAEQAAAPRQTNLETALLSALARLSPERRASLVLFSDGRETAGNVAEILGYVRRLGVAVYPLAPPVTGAATTAWEELAVSPVVRRGSPVAVQLVVFNAAPDAKRGRLTVALQGVAIKRQAVTVRPGWQVLTASVPSVQRGTMALDVSLEIPEQGFRETRSAYTHVEGPPQVLVVSDQMAALPALAQALKRREIDIAVARPTELPSTAGALEVHDAVILYQVAKSTLSAEQASALTEYVTRGGGLVTVGLGGDLAQELNTPSPVDPLLPVTFKPKGLQQAKRRICIVMLIDRSSSMMGPRLGATKRAAIELVKQLAPEDLVGVLAFDTQAYVVVEVQSAAQAGRTIVEKLVTLRSSGGTDVLPALAAAANRLELTDAAAKHIILLSDGNTPVHEKAYAALLQSFKLQGITISTIGIGAAFINDEYLRWLAGMTGGSFYIMRSLDELPKLIARDTGETLGRLPFTEGAFRPERAPSTDWFDDAGPLPTLRGYLTAEAKESARVDLTVTSGEGDLPAAPSGMIASAAQAGDPLLARWQVGQGRVVTFASDADQRWSPDWIRWPGFEGAWAQIVRWAMRRQPSEEVFVWVDDSQGVPQLVVEGDLRDPRGALVSPGGAATIPLSFMQTGAFRWRAPLAQVPSGWYEASLRAAGSEGQAPSAVRWVRVGTPPAGAEESGQPPRESLLRQIARSTAGAYDTPDLALVPPTAAATSRVPLIAWWLPLVILALLVDVALRGPTML